MAAALGLELVWEFRRWDRFAGALADGEVDAIWCGSAITDERRKVFSYSRPYAAIDEAVLVRADSGIHSLADLRGRQRGRHRRLHQHAAGRVVRRGGAGRVRRLLRRRVRRDGRGRRVGRGRRDGRRRAGVRRPARERRRSASPTWPRRRTPGVPPAAWATTETVALLDDGIGRAVASGALADVWRTWFGAKPVPAVIAG